MTNAMIYAQRLNEARARMTADAILGRSATREDLRREAHYMGLLQALATRPELDR